MSTQDSFDRIAASYGEVTRRPVDLAENAIIRQWVRPMLSRAPAEVLDVGCGGGLLLDLAGDLIRPSRYVGVDVSLRMLALAREAHPDYANHMHHLDVRSIHHRYGNVVSLFGAFNYMPPHEMQDTLGRVMGRGAEFFLVLYGWGFHAAGHWWVDDLMLARPYTEREIRHVLAPIASEVRVRGLSLLAHWLPWLPWGPRSVRADTALAQACPSAATFLVVDGKAG